MASTVPSVDITPYVRGGSVAEQSAVSGAIDQACRGAGLFQVFGHGIPAQTQAGLAAAMDTFFRLSPEAKQRYRTPPEVNRGYSPPHSESLSLSLGVESASSMNDYFEAFNVGTAMSDYPGVDVDPVQYAENLWPAVPGFRTRVSAYFVEAQRVARTIVRIFADALDLPGGFFHPYTDHSIDVLRMNYYALPAGTADPEGDLTGMSEHTDYGIVTVLWADQVAGLQVLGADGTWNDLIPAEGALLIQLGDLMARWTNERWSSPLHRVKPPIVDGTIERRRSAAFYVDGNVDALISSLPSCVSADRPNLYQPVTVAEHLAAKLAGSRAGVCNEKAEREAARLLAARQP